MDDFSQSVSADNLSLMYVKKLVNTKTLRQPSADEGLATTLA